MADNQQRRKSAGEEAPKSAPSTGRRGSHQAAQPSADTKNRGERKKRSLDDDSSPTLAVDES